MARELVCDLCKRTTPALAGKLFFTPINPGSGGRNRAYSRYTLHLDVGVCCVESMKKKWNWRERLVAAVYHNRGKNAAV